MALSPSLQDLIFLALERRASGELGAVDELCREHPAHAHALRELVEQLETSGMLDESDGADAGAPDGEQRIPDRFGEYRLVRRIGQGGMGVVYLAEQPALGRQVALKIMRPEQVYFEQARERFRREVRSVARLAHPGIVPLFASGEAAGLPFFTMALVEGVSLAEALRGLEGRDPATLVGRDLFDVVQRLSRERGFDGGEGRPDDPLFGGGWPVTTAWLVREVAQALEHAHQRGVLHRDIKPSNVLLTVDARVLLVDFGLASLLSVDRMTRAGAQLGSLPYMAPEQIAGDVERIDARTDVYGLGVLMYETATLRAPFDESDASRLGARIASGDVPPLRRVNKSLPADFETVCRTAMDVEPERRYASPAHVARDLTNLLQRRPIDARPLGPGLTLVRWAQRRPALAVALALGSLIVVGGPLVIAALEVRSSRQLARERDLAHQNLDAALEAVDVLLERVGHSELREVPRLERLRSELLIRATDLYTRLEASSRGDVRARLRVASALGKLAKVRQENGDRPGALAGFDAAEARLLALAEEYPANAAVLFELGNLSTFAAASRYPGDPAAAIEAFGAAIEVLRRACALDPTARRPRAELSRGLSGLAHFQDTLGQDEAALVSYAEAEALAAGLIRECEPSDRAWTDAVELEATAQGRAASIHWFMGEEARATALFEGVLRRCEELETLSGFMRQLRAVCIQMLVQARGKTEGASRDRAIDELLALAQADAVALASEFPGNARYGSSAAHGYMALGRRALRFAEHDAARSALEECVRLHRALDARHPAEPSHVGNAAIALAVLGDLDRELALLAAAAERYHTAASLHAACLARGGSASNGPAALASARSAMEVALERGDGTSLERISKELPLWLPRSFEAAVDAAQGAMYAVGLLESGQDQPRLAALRTNAAQQLARALDMKPDQRALVKDYAHRLGLADDPALVGRLEG
jgi:serine/threonine protein kinase